MIRHKVKILSVQNPGQWFEKYIGQEVEILGNSKHLNYWKDVYLLTESQKKLLGIDMSYFPKLPKECCSLPEKYEPTPKKKKVSKQKHFYSLEEVEKISKLSYELGQGSVIGPDKIEDSELYYSFDFEFILENI